MSYAVSFNLFCEALHSLLVDILKSIALTGIYTSYGHCSFCSLIKDQLVGYWCIIN